MPNRELRACTTVEVELDKCALRYGEGACNARARGALAFVEQATWLQGSGVIEGTAYYAAASERLIVNDVSATGVDRIGGIPRFLRSGWQEVARWRVGSASVGGFGVISSTGEVTLSNTPLTGAALPQVDTSGDWRVRVIDSLSHDATSGMGALDYRSGTDTTSTYRIGALTNITNAFSGGVTSGQGFIIVERNSEADLLAGTWRLRRSSLGWVEVGRWNVGLDTVSGNATIESSGEVSFNNTPVSGERLPTTSPAVTQQYRIRIMGNSAVSDRASRGLPLIFERGNADVGIYRFGTATQLQATFPDEVGTGGGQIIVESLLNERVAEGPLNLQNAGNQTRILIGQPTIAAAGDRGVNYVEVNRWNAAAVSNGNAEYNGSTGILAVSLTDANGNAPSTTTSAQTYYRLSRGNASLEGVIGTANLTTAEMDLIVGSVEEMRATFGNSNINSGDAWVLERGDFAPATPGFVSPMRVFVDGNPTPENNNTPVFTYHIDKMQEVEPTGETQCYNTFASCQDRDNYTKRAPGRVYKFCSEGVILDGFAPIIKGQPDHQPVAIKKDFGLFQREKVTVNLLDEAGPDTSLDDDYLLTRGTVEGGRPVTVPASITYEDVASWNQGDGANEVGRAHITITTQDDDTIFVANNTTATGSIPADLTGNWRLTRHGGGLPDAVLIGSFAKLRDTASGAQYRVGNAADMTYAFQSGIPNGEVITFPTITASWNQGDSASIHNAYFDEDSGNLSVSTTELTGDLSESTVTSYEEVARWNWGDDGTSGNAEYVAADVTNPNSICANNTPASGTAPLFNNPPNNDNRWDALTAPSWNGTAGYPANSYALRNNTLYQAIVAVTAANTAPNQNPLVDNSRWVDLGETVWSSITSYNAGVYVSHNDALFRAISNITYMENDPPPNDTTRWTGVTPETWNEESAYSNGALVLYSGSLYQANSDISASVLNASPPNSSWDTISAGGWNSHSSYNSGAFVVYLNNLYRSSSSISAGGLTRQSSADYTSLSSQWSPQGGFAIGNRAFVVNTTSTSNDQGTAVHSYNFANGVLTDAQSRTQLGSSGRWWGAVASGNNVWIVNDTTNTARAYTHSNGVLSRAVANDLSLGTGDWVGAVSVGNRVWFVNRENPDTAVCYTNSNGTLTRTSAGDVSLGNSLWRGAFAIGDDVFFMGGSSGESLRAYTHNNGTLTRAAANDATLPSGNWGGAFAIGNNVWFLRNNPDAFVGYTFVVRPNPQTDTANWTSISTPNWSSAATYASGNFVRTVTGFFRANTAITPSSPNLNPSQSASWTARPVTSWGATFSYAPNVYVIYQSNYYRSLVTIAATSVNNAPNVDVGNWNAITPPAWNSTLAYDANTYVSRSGSFYRALNDIAAVGASSAPNVDTARWNVLSANDWSSALAYNANAYAVYNSALYRALNNVAEPPPSNNNPTFDTARWNQINAPGWSGVAGYSTGDYVRSDGVLYIALNDVAAPAIHHAPNTDTARWTPIKNTVWSGTAAYSQNDYVISGGVIYRAINAITAPSVGSTNTAPQSDATNWASVGTSVWSNTAAYNQNAVVSITTNIPTKLSASSDITENQHAFINNPHCMWGDGTVLWVAANQLDDYNLATGLPIHGQNNLELGFYNNGAPAGMWGSGNDMSFWVSDSDDGQIYHYNHSTTGAANFTRNPRGDFSSSLLSGDGINNPQGIWCDGTTMWIADDTANKIFAYDTNLVQRGGNIPTGGGASWITTRAPAKDFNTLAAAGNTNPRGIWSDGITMWVVDLAADKVFAYNMMTKARDIAKEFNGFGATGATQPVDIYTNGSTMYILNSLPGPQQSRALAYSATPATGVVYYRATTNIPAFTENTAPATDTTNWQAVSATAWSASSSYANNAVVSYQSNYYTATTSITASGPNIAPNIDTTNWQLVASPAWSASSGYANNAIVSYQTILYQASSTIPAPNITPNTPPENDSANWQVVIPTAWTNTSAYSQHALVAFMSNNYVAVHNIPAAPGENAQPQTDTARWSPVSVPTWNATTGYSTNAITAFNSNYYRATTVISAPAASNPFPEADTERWRSITTPAWDINTDYTALSYVIHNLVYYRASSSISNAPVGIFRLTTNASTPQTLIGEITHTADGNGKKCWRVGSQQDMIDTFGSANITASSSTYGAQLILERQVITSGLTGNYRIRRTGGGLPDASAIGVITLSDQMVATGHSAQATWRQGDATSTQTAHLTPNGDFVYNGNPLTGDDAINATRTYRLRRTGGGAPEAIAEGALNVVSVGAYGARLPNNDFDTLPKDNEGGTNLNLIYTGSYADNTNLYVAVYSREFTPTTTNTPFIFAFNRVTKTRDIAAGFTSEQLAANNGINSEIFGVWGDGNTLYASGFRGVTPVICAYNQQTKARIPSLDIPIASDIPTRNVNVRGIYGSGNFIYAIDNKFGIGEDNFSRIVAFERTARIEVDSRSTNFIANYGLTNPQDLWSDGTTLYVTNNDDDNDNADTVFAFNFQTRSREPAKDFATLNAAGNNAPTGIWGLGGYVGISDAVDEKVYAYSISGERISNGERDIANDFNTLSSAGVDAPRGLHTDGTIMFVLDSVDNRIYAFANSTKARSAGGDFTGLTTAGNTDPWDITATSSIMYVLNAGSGANRKVFAYDIVTKARRANDDLPLGLIGAPDGVAIHGNIMYVSSSADAKIYAYNLTTKGRDATKDIESVPLDGLSADSGKMTVYNGKLYITTALDRIQVFNLTTRAFEEANSFDTLGAAGASLLGGITAHNNVMYVADVIDDKIYAFKFAPTTQAEPGLRLRIGGAANMISAFGAGIPGNPNAQPQTVPVDWRAVSPVNDWDRTIAYSANDVVRHNGIYYRARVNNGPFPIPQGDYVEVVRWGIGPANVVTNGATYNPIAGGAFTVANAGTSGSLPTGLNFDTNLWRLQVTGNSAVANNISRDGLRLSRASTLLPSHSSLFAPVAPMLNTYWENVISGGGGQVILSRLENVVDNAPPNLNVIAWEEIIPSVWDSSAAYAVNAVVSHNGMLYQALRAISAVSGSITDNPPNYTWHLEFATFAVATDRKHLRVNTPGLMRFEFQAGNPSPANVDTPNFTWIIERQVIASVTETSRPPNYTYTLARVVNTPASTNIVQVQPGEPGVITPQSTIQKRWLERNKYFNRRPAKFSVGYIDGEGGNDVFIPTFTANLTIDTVSLNTGGDTLTLTMKDGINITAKEGAVVPKPTNIEIATPVEADDIDFVIQGQDAGMVKVGDDINVGREVMRVLSVNAANNVITIGVERARAGTTASSARRGDTVQICYTKTAVNAGEIIKDLMDNFADTGGVTFAETEFNDLRDIYFGSFPVTAIITKPVGVDTIIQEIQRSTLATMWHDSSDPARQLRIKSITGLNFGFSPDAVPLNDDDIIGDSVSLIERPRESVTRILTFSGLNEATDFGKDSKDWRNVIVRFDADTESDNARGEARQYELFSRWINSSQASVVADRLLQEGKVNSSDFTFEVPIRDGGKLPVTVGEVYSYNGKFSQNFYGGEEEYPFRVLQISIKDFRTAKVLATRSSVSLRDVSAFIIGKSVYDGEDVML